VLLYTSNRSDVRARSLRDSMLHRVRLVRATLGPTFVRQAVMFRLVLMVFANFVSMRMEMSMELACRCITATGGEIWVSRPSAYTFVVLILASGIFIAFILFNFAVVYISSWVRFKGKNPLKGIMAKRVSKKEKSLD
jgi:hypothetical protein